jgi:hypothetical protein
VTEVTLDHLRPSPEWEQQGKDLEAVKEAEAMIRRGLDQLAERRKAAAEQRRLLREVAAEFSQEAEDPF